MSRAIFLLLGAAVAALFPALAQAQADTPKPPVVGLWMGKLNVEIIDLRLALQLELDPDKKLTGKLISIDQNRAEIPIKTVTWADGQLTLDLPLIQAKYTGKYDAKAQAITGEYTQAGNKFPLEFKRIDELPSAKRPQHPKPPFPYLVEDVTFENAAAKVKLAGTLTRSKGTGPFPAVVLVSGSGPQDRDETIFDHKPFLVIADHLSRAGYAVLRYDDRGVGQSTGNHDTATSADFASDAAAAVSYLRSRKEIDAKFVGIIGHSEGGLIAPMVAAEHPNDVAFLVLLAAPGVPGDQIIARQVRDLLKAQGEPAEQIDLISGLQAALLAAAKASKSSEEASTAIRQAGEAYARKLTEEQRKKLELDEEGLKKQVKLWDQLAKPWERYFLQHDPVPVLQKVKCPVLALTGEKDLQVDAGINQPKIAAALKAGGNERVTVRTLPELNHLFQKCKTGQVREYGTIEETFNAEALKVLADWLSQVTVKR